MVRRYDDIEDYIADVESRYGVDMSPVFNEYGETFYSDIRTYERFSCPRCGKHRISVVGADPDWSPDWHGHVVKVECGSCGWTKTGEVSI